MSPWHIDRYWSINHFHQSSSKSERRILYIRWKPPDPLIKINLTELFFIINVKQKLGFVIKDHSGNLLLTSLKMLVMLMFRWLKQFPFEKICVNLFIKVSNLFMLTPDASNFWLKTFSCTLALLADSITLKHILREPNFVADASLG